MRSPARNTRIALFATLALMASSLAFGQVASFMFAPASPTVSTPVEFTDTSTGSPTLWLWNFGDPNSGTANTSALQNPTHSFTDPGDHVVTLLVSGGSMSSQTITVTSGGAGTCVTNANTLCLEGNRFQVTAIWTKPTGETGPATAVRLTDASGYFWFFDPTNIEMVTKVLDGCAINNAHWVFAAGLTNVRVDWQVTDTVSGIVFPQTNEQGTPFVAVQATDAFPNSCP